jgi:NDP-sugar pyrophosphorylase family protein
MQPDVALVLTAGLGTRLRPLTEVRAKPAIPVAGVPLIRRIVAWLASQQVTDLVLNLHHLPETLTKVVGDGGDLGVRVRYSWEQPRVLGSAGGPRLALPIVGRSTFFAINGDTLTDLDLSTLADAHAASGAQVTLALVPNREFLRYGGVRLDAQDRVIGFVGRGPAAEGSYHYIGAQIVEADVFASLTPGEPANSIGGVYDALLAARPGSVRGLVCDAAFWDVGTVEDYWRMSHAFADGLRDANGTTIGRKTTIDPSARVGDSILWDHVAVGPHAHLDACIVADRVAIPAGARFDHAVIVPGASGEPIASPRERS